LPFIPTYKKMLGTKVPSINLLYMFI